MVSDGVMAMMCCTTWAGVLPDISCKGISLCTIAFTSTYLTAVDCMVVCTGHKVSDHTCKVSCVVTCFIVR